MNFPILLTFRWNLKDWEECHKYAYRCPSRKTVRPPKIQSRAFYTIRYPLYVSLGIILSICSGIYGLYVIATILSLIIYLLCSIGVVWLVGRVLRPWTIRKAYADWPIKDAEIEWHINNGEVIGKTPRIKTELQWESFNKALHTPSGLLLYAQNNLYYWWPIHGFTNIVEYEQVVELVKSKVPEFYDIRK